MLQSGVTVHPVICRVRSFSLIKQAEHNRQRSLLMNPSQSISLYRWLLPFVGSHTNVIRCYQSSNPTFNSSYSYPSTPSNHCGDGTLISETGNEYQRANNSPQITDSSDRVLLDSPNMLLTLQKPPVSVVPQPSIPTSPSPPFFYSYSFAAPPLI